MDQLIVYGSQYGTTQRYAERFSELTRLPCIRSEAVKDLSCYGRVIHFGGLYAGGGQGPRRTPRALGGHPGGGLCTLGAGGGRAPFPPPADPPTYRTEYEEGTRAAGTLAPHKPRRLTPARARRAAGTDCAHRRRMASRPLLRPQLPVRHSHTVRHSPEAFAAARVCHSMRIFRR